jgi:uncharacterized surface protein with fasciclin (FAS1) repeats
MRRMITMEFDPRLAYGERNLIPKRTSTYLGPANGADMKTNIVDALNKLGNFKTLLTAIKTAGLEEKMATRYPTTLFAPTDEAFKKLPPDNVAILLQNPETLKELLLFHVHPGILNCTRNARTFNTALKDGEKAKQLVVKVTSWTEEVFIVTGQEEHPKVTTRGIRCTNGLIHVMSEVMIPYEGTNPPQVTFIGARDMKKEATLQQGYYGSIKGTDRHGNVYTGPKRDYVPIPVTREGWVSATHYADPPKNSAGMSSVEVFDW